MTTMWLRENQDWLTDVAYVNLGSQVQIDAWRKEKKDHRAKYDPEYGKPMWRRTTHQSRRFVVLRDPNCYRLFENLIGGKNLTHFQKSNYLLKHPLLNLLLDSDLGRWEGLTLQEDASAYYRQWQKYLDSTNCSISHFAVFVWAYLRHLDKALSFENDEALAHLQHQEGMSLAEYCLQQMPEDWFPPQEKKTLMWLLQSYLKTKLMDSKNFLGISDQDIHGENKEVSANILFRIIAQATDRTKKKFIDLYNLSYHLWLCEKLTYTVDGWGIPQEDAQLTIHRGKANYIELSPSLKKNKLFFEEWFQQVSL